MRRWLVLAIALVGVATLWPLPELDRATGQPLVRLDLYAADFARNLALFVPVGALLARRSLPGAVGWALAGSLVVELIQLGIPGRVPSPWDVAANGIGAAIGHVCAAASLGRSRRGRHDLARTAYGLWATGVVFAVGVAAVGQRPALPPPPYFAHWTPDLGHLETYRGRLDTVTLDGVPLPHGTVRVAGIRSMLGSGHTLVARGEAGPPPRALSGLVMITDGEGREVAMFGLEGPRAMYRLRTLGTAVGLEPPFPWWDDAFAGIAPGAPFQVVVRHDGARLCMAVSGRERCGLAPRIEDGWLQWLPAPALDAPTRGRLGTLWLALLFAPLGYGLRAGAVQIVGLAAAGGAIAAAPLLGPVEAASPAVAAAVALAVALGWLAGRLRARRAQAA